MLFKIVKRFVGGDIEVVSNLHIWAALNAASHLSQEPGDVYIMINLTTGQEIVLIDEEDE